MSDKLQRAGDIKLEKIELTTAKGKVDLYNIMAEFNLFESIDSPSLSAVVLINDTQNLIQSLPISGNELIHVEFVTPSFPNTMRIVQDFVVTKIADRQIGASEHQQAYNLYCVTPEQAVDYGMKISKKFEGTADQVTRKVLREYLKTEKTMSYDVPANSISFVSPFWNPFKVINYYVTQSVKAQTNVPNYIFFETNKEYRLACLESLYAKSPKAVFKHDNNPQRKNDNKDTQAEFEQCLEVRFMEHYNEKDRIDVGLHHTKSYLHDVTSKTLKSIVFSYENSFNKTKHLGAYPMIPNESAKHRVVTHKQTYSKVHDGFPYDYAGYVKNMRNPTLYDLELLRLDITVRGRTDLEVGDIVEFKMNTWGEKANLKEPQEDKYYSGKYIITAMHHRFNQFQHQITMQIAKNASERPL